jgi:hypothetical protein
MAATIILNFTTLLSFIELPYSHALCGQLLFTCQKLAPVFGEGSRHKFVSSVV